MSYEVRAIGFVEQQKENSTIIRIKDAFLDACDGLENNMKVIILCWLHLSDNPLKRNTLKVHPKGDQHNPLKGVFATRSPTRPNPIGHYTVKIKKLDLPFIEIEKIDAYIGTPVIDIRPFIKHLDCPSP